MEKKIVTLYLDSDEYEFLRSYSYRAKKSMSSILRDCLSWLQAATYGSREAGLLPDTETVAEDKVQYVVKARKDSPPFIIDKSEKSQMPDVCGQPSEEGGKPAEVVAPAFKPQVIAGLEERVQQPTATHVLRLLEDATASFLQSSYFRPSLVTDGSVRGKGYGKAVSDLKLEQPLSADVIQERRGGM
ncbi:MAG TPA: hypothetical protein GX507_10680 [Clostridia bacterium]|nr:hypothetical protein [Clostridia bacterium]